MGRSHRMDSWHSVTVSRNDEKMLSARPRCSVHGHIGAGLSVSLYSVHDHAVG